jgi:hypothetical protein
MLRIEYYNNLQMKYLTSNIKRDDKVKIRLQILSYPKKDLWLKSNDSVQNIVDLAILCILKPWTELEETKSIRKSKSINNNTVRKKFILIFIFFYLKYNKFLYLFLYFI